MKLYHFNYHEDFGDEWTFHFLKGERRSFFHLYIDKPTYKSPPSITLTIGVDSGFSLQLNLGIIFIYKSFFGRHFD